VHQSTSQQRVTKDVTFVVTDVAGSTELWEWNAEVMDLALQLHDATLRTLIFKHLGHEVTTEGDSFSIVFHDATDALQWCLQVQQVHRGPKMAPAAIAVCNTQHAHHPHACTRSAGCGAPVLNPTTIICMPSGRLPASP
jgi:class 3 adenylate cyclase